MFNELKREMSEQHITTNRLAKMANITPQDLYAALAGKREMFPGWRKRIAEALGVPEEALFSDEEVERE